LNISLEFERKPIRSVIVGHQIWCAIDDLALVLQEPASSLLARLEADEKRSMPTENSGRDLAWASEWGIYSLVRNSPNLPSQRFKKWLKEEATIAWRQTSNSPTTITAREAIDLAIPLFQDLGVERECLSIWLLGQYQRIYPAHGDIFVDIRSSAEPELEELGIKPEPAMETEVDAETQWRSPTEIGQLVTTKYELGFVLSPQKVNRALAALDFQILITLVEKKEWKLTKLGQPYGKMANCFDPTGRKRLQIRWLPDVVPMVAQQLGLS
jgi:BRO family, N-terminal domain